MAWANERQMAAEQFGRDTDESWSIHHPSRHREYNAFMSGSHWAREYCFANLKILINALENIDRMDIFDDDQRFGEEARRALAKWKNLNETPKN